MLPQAMVVFASEQLWPNIQGLVHWHRHGGGLKDLCIYYTDDEHRSAGPARRFAKLAQKLIPPLHVHLPEKAGGKFPKDVLAQITRWHEELPNRRWIINATGGLKLMFAGALQGIDLPNSEVVYRELSGEWFSIAKSDHGLEVRPLLVDLSVSDDIPVEYLVKAQSEMASESQWSCDTPKPLPIVELIKKGLRTDWSWQEMFRNVGLPVNEKPGFLFEKFAAATLLEFGINQVALNAQVISKNGQALQEIDIIANYRGRILIFDCKLRTREQEESQVEGLTSQIRQAATIRRDIGGAGAKLLMIRPGRGFSPAEQELAQALELHVLDNSATMDFFRRIADFCEIGPNLPPKIAQAQELLDKAREQGELEAFARSSFLPTSEGGEPRKAVIRLESHLNQYMEELNQDWAVYTIFNRTFLYLRLDRDWKRHELQTELQEIFRPYAMVCLPQISKAGRSGCAQLVECDLNNLKGFLSQFVGKSLWGSKGE